MIRLLSIILMLCPIIVFGQGVFKSSNESSSLLQLRETSIQPFLNTAVFQLGETPIEYDFMHSIKDYFIGFKTSAKSNSSIASIFKNNDLVLGYKGNISFGKVFYINGGDILKSTRDKLELKLYNLGKDEKINREKKEILLYLFKLSNKL